MNKILYNKLIKSIKKGLYESSMFNDDIFNNEENILSELEVDDKISKYKLIDLGLPSGTLWSDRNIGAKNPYTYGLYFQWGDSAGHTASLIDDYNEQTYKFNIRKNKYSKYNTTDDLHVLLLEDDGAYMFDHNLCIPSREQFRELLNNCIQEWCDSPTFIGYKFKSRINNAVIYFPITNAWIKNSGTYWINEKWSTKAYSFFFTKAYLNCDATIPRFYNYQIRAVERKK